MNKWLITFVIFNFNFFVHASEIKKANCSQVIINFNPNSITEEKAAQKLKNHLTTLKKDNDFQFDVTLTNETTNSNFESIMENNSLLLDLNAETDFTGSEVNLNTYKKNHLGELVYSGGIMMPARFRKDHALFELAKTAFHLSCGMPSYLY